MKLNLRYPMFESQCEPAGFLNRDKECHALWYYTMLAMKNRAQVGKGPESQTLTVPVGQEGSMLWMDKRYVQIARGVGMLYGIDLNKMFNYWPLVILEAARLDMEIPSEIMTTAPGKENLN